MKFFTIIKKTMFWILGILFFGWLLDWELDKVSRLFGLLGIIIYLLAMILRVLEEIKNRLESISGNIFEIERIYKKYGGR